MSLRRTVCRAHYCGPMASDPVNRCFNAVQKVVPDFEGMRTLPPASNEQIAALETAIGLTLPSELVAWLKLVNGHHHGFCVSLGWNFLSTDEIAMHWGFFAEPAQAIAPLIQRTDHPHRVKVPSTFTKRIPIASDYSGNLLMIDLDPISAEFLGQIVFVERTADSVSFVVMSSFEALLNTISAQIDTGELALVDGNLVFTNNNAGMLRPWYVLSRGFRYPTPSLDTALMSKAETESPQVSDSPTAGATQTESTGSGSVQTEPTIDERASFVSGLTEAQRSACYVAQNDLLQTDQFGPQDDLDLRFTVLTFHSHRRRRNSRILCRTSQLGNL
jgi:cell wall assembly regulator SMI1